MDARVFGKKAFEPVSGVPLALFRIAFGLCLLWTVGYFLKGDRIASMFTDASFRFAYFGFGWVRPMSEFGMRALFWALGALALCVTAGLFSRASAALFALGFGYAFLIDRVNYVNHNYLFVLLAFLLAWTPSGAALSLDALFRGRTEKVPGWADALFRFQFAVVYAFAGLAKLNGDWLSGREMRTVLRKEAFVTGAGWLATPSLGTAAAWSAMGFDLLAAPLLLHKKARWPTLVVAVLFHAINDRLFTIGMFPWAMLAGTVCFFFADVIGRLARRVRESEPATTAPRSRRATAAALAAYAAVQLALPLRHYLYPGDVRWTEEGGTFAWRMMLDEKHAYARFFVRDPVSGREWEATAANYLTSRQRQKVAGDPVMLRDLSRHLADEWRAAGFPGVEVRTEAMASLNGRPFQPLVDPSVDLAAAPRSPWHAPWIAPFPADGPPAAVDGGGAAGSTADVLSP